MVETNEKSNTQVWDTLNLGLTHKFGFWFDVASKLIVYGAMKCNGWLNLPGNDFMVIKALAKINYTIHRNNKKSTNLPRFTVTMTNKIIKVCPCQ